MEEGKKTVESLLLEGQWSLEEKKEFCEMEMKVRKLARNQQDFIGGWIRKRTTSW